MPNFNAVFKAEVARLARKEAKIATEGLRKTASRQRSEIVALKRQVADLERRLKGASTTRVAATPAVAAEGDAPKARFSPKWVLADRKRLGLSAKNYGQLVGVTGLTIYNWEKGRSKPRTKQLAAWASVRGMGKREALTRLSQNGQ